jgi:HK97 family phage portal protein
MKFCGFNITRDKGRNAAKSYSPGVTAWLQGESSTLQSCYGNLYADVAWIYRAVNLIAEQVANTPFLISTGERGRETLITGGPLQKFYARPHPQISAFEYWELRVIWLMLRGECFRVPTYVPDRHAPRGRRLDRVLILDPTHFHEIIEDHELVGWRYTGVGPHSPLDSQVLLPEEVWFEKLPNPMDLWRGLAPLQAANMAARTDFAASAFMRGVIENNGDAGTIFSTDTELSDEQHAQVTASLKGRKRRAGTPDEPILLSGGVEITRPTLSSTDLQFLENRKFSRAEICAAFGVPEELIGGTEHAKYDVMRGARLNFIENRIAPICRRLESGETALVNSVQPGAVGWFDLDSIPIMQDAQRQRLDAAAKAFGMGVPLNELNRIYDLGFKHQPNGDIPYVASTVNPVTSPNDGASVPES